MEHRAIDRTKQEDINNFLEEYYEDGESIKAGEEMAKVKMEKSQVRGLENLIASTTRFSEIINYIKNQTGKGKKEWAVVGPLLIEQLATLEEKARDIAGEDGAVRLAVKLRLAKGWARQVVAHYLFQSR